MSHIAAMTDVATRSGEACMASFGGQKKIDANIFKHVFEPEYALVKLYFFFIQLSNVDAS